MVFAIVCSEDGGRVGREAEDGFQLAFHRTLLLRLHIVADGIGLGLHVVLFTIAETVDGEVGLQRILRGKFVDTSNVPAEPLVTHLIICATRDIGTSVRTIGNLVGIVKARIQC